MTDERLDFELVAFLREHAEDLYGAPDAGAMTWRLSAQEGSIRRRLDRLVARPVVRLALVAMLLGALVGASVIAGAVRRGVVTNGSILLSAGLVMDPATGKMSGSSFCAGRCSDAIEVSYSRDGGTLALVDQDGLSGDLQTGAQGPSVWRYGGTAWNPTLVAQCPLTGACGRTAFSVDGRKLAYVETDSRYTDIGDTSVWRLIVVDLATGKSEVVPHPDGAPVWLSWTADGRIVASIQAAGLLNRRTVVIDPATGATVEPFTRWPFATATASPDGSLIAFLVNGYRPRSDGILHPEDHVFDIWVAASDGRGLRHLYHGDPADFDSGSRVVWSPDGRRLAVGAIPIGGSPTVLIIDGVTGALLQSFDGPSSVTAWSPAG